VRLAGLQQARPDPPRSALSNTAAFGGPIRLREVRLASGLVLGAFLLTHLGNHALGLVSVAAMEQGREWFERLWRNPLGTILLYGSLLLHFALALEALYRRHTLRMPLQEAAQLALGLSIPFLVIPHVVGTRIELLLTGREVGYPEMIRTIWITSPESGLRQSVALVVAWVHACLGIRFWLRPKPWFQRSALLLYTGALLVPVLALLGFAEGGQEIAAEPEQFLPRSAPASGQERLTEIRMGLYLAFAAVIGATLAARAVRPYRSWSTRVRITYPGGHIATIPRGFSVLEASRMAGIPHISVCGGQGRCSTCRVRVIEGLDAQPAPTPQEGATLARIKAGPDVRLACQFQPTDDLTIVPILATDRRRMSRAFGGSRAAGAQEREIAVLFCDLRDFTRLTERRLPFDTVFILNRYFEVVGHAVEEAGGHLDKFVGDGALALFGLTTPVQEGSRQAVDAALRISRGVARLNETYASELERPLRIAMGLHAGPAIVGEMGYGHATGLTAVGDTLNVASRLEGLAKDLDAELIVSADLASRAGLDLSGFEQQTMSVRGRSVPIEMWIVRKAADIAVNL
jgi:adenylate cyclase